MPLKRYLFISFAALIVLLFLVQIAVTGLLQRSFNEAVVEQSQSWLRQTVDDPRFNDEVLAQLSQQMQAMRKQLRQQRELLQGHDLPAQTREQLAQENQQLRQQAHQLAEAFRNQLRRHIGHMDNMGPGHGMDGMMMHPSYNNWQRGPLAASSRLLTYPAFWIGIGVAILLGWLATFWISHRVSKPLQHLQAGHRQLATGTLGIQLQEEGSQELRQTIRDFNQMSEQLAEWQQLLKRQQQLEQLAELGEISRGMAHALRSPLHVIGLALEQLADEQDPEQKQQLQHQIRQKMQAIDHHIQQLLAIKQDAPREQEINIPALLEDLQLELSSHPKHPTLQCSYGENLPLLRGNDIELRNIIHTVLVNAVEASPDNATILIDTHCDNNSYVLKITDQGKGLDEAIKARLFQPHITTKPDGAGMGLYIARRQIRLHYDGDITLRNNPGGGCIATITLKDINHA